MTALYNELDPYAARWLENLIAAGHIAKGDVDARSIAELRAADLVGRTQCHFFAGIGVWSSALRDAGWPDDREVWTGSCPCQPFSAAGKGGGFDDERHLWPTWFALIRECRPATIFGEQVASSDGLTWFDLVHADLEGAGYAVGAADLPAAGVGAPHLRQRLYFVANAKEERRGSRRTGKARHGQEPGGRQEQSGGLGETVVLGDTDSAGDANRGSRSTARAQSSVRGEAREQRIRFDAWEPGDAVYCLDGKWRPIESGTFPLAHGVTARVGQVRAYGNAIVQQVAATFIRAAMESMP